MKQQNLIILILAAVIFGFNCNLRDDISLPFYSVDRNDMSNFIVKTKKKEILNYFKLKSLQFAENKNLYQTDKFYKILKSIPFDSPIDSFKESIFAIDFYTNSEIKENIFVSHQNCPAISIYTFDNRRMMHHFFELNRQNRYSLVPSFSQPVNYFSSKVTVLLSYSTVRRENKSIFSIISFRRNLSNEAVNTLNALSKIENNNLLDAIAADLERNFGFALMRDNAPGGSGSCKYSFCEACELGAGICQRTPPIGQCVCSLSSPTSDCVSLSINQFAFENKISFEIDIEKLRRFRDTFMVSRKIPRKYIAYYELYSRHAQVSLSNIEKYMDILPYCYNAADLLTSSGNNNEIIISDSFYEKALEIINGHSDIDNPSFRLMIEDVKQDLIFLKNKNKGQVMDYIKDFGIPNFPDLVFGS